MKILKFALIVSMILLVGSVWAQELYDPDYTPTVDNPAYTVGSGPVVLVDEAHNNYHTIEGRYKAFADLLKADGYTVQSNTQPFTAEALADADVLVIANALNVANVTAAESDPWITPILPALTGEEINAVVTWVEGGGNLLLIADHMPFPGAINALAARFGIIWQSCFAFAGNFAFGAAGPDPNLITFKLGTPDASGGIGYDHPIFEGRNAGEAVSYASSFTGSAFRLAPGSEARKLFELGTGPSSLVAYPTNHIDISQATPMALALGLLQGATLEYGEGRAVFVGEAAMFAARIANFIAPGYPLGMNNTDLAPHNKQFTLNMLHWLDGTIPVKADLAPGGLITSGARAGGMRAMAGKLVPETYALHQNSPNPFNPETEILYAVPEQVSVRIDVYNSLGQQVRTLVKGQHSPGTYAVKWNGLDQDGHQVTTGVYLYKMNAGTFSGSGKMILMQ